ncbi:MAG TPA: prolyl oligopeptidase family serine peptidase [Bryobacteraceae bacterium]|jgi:prolyl oligopeptidase|nr:prolyl oligopeptidase family serine peptidase [Bryobacteraceae bacterium]
MKYAACWLVAVAMLTLAADPKVNGNKIVYPVAKKVNVVDDYNGVKVPDPYRWLEDTNSPETTAWVAAENKVTQAYLAQIPERDKIRKRLTELFDYERYPASYLDGYAGVFQAGGKHFIFRNNGLQNQYVLYVTDKPGGQERVLLDPNVLRADGTAALSALSVDHSGKLLAYAIAQAGSDWSEWHVRDIATGKDLPDLLQWTKFTSAAWTHDGRGFYYQSFPQPDSKAALTASNEKAKLYLHRIGEPQSSDQLIYQRPDQPRWMFGPQVSDDGRYLVNAVFGGDESWNLLFYQDLQSGPGKMVELINEQKAKYNFLGNDGSRFYIQTTDNAPKGRIIIIDVNHPEHANWKEIVPEQKETLVSAQLVSAKLILSYLKDAHAQAKVAGLDGKIQHEIALPGLGGVEWSPAYSTDSEMFYSFVSFTSPPAIYRYDVKSNQSTVYRQSKLSFDPSQYETEQVFYSSKDGTRVPMFLVHRKGLKRDGQNPTLLYGYGGFNIAMTPTFSPWFLGWMEAGGVLAIANLRGGSEYGESWHQAGTKLHKQNVFDDFIAAAEWLIANKYTSTPKLAIHGGSNGGLLIGAVLNQRPDLFGAAMPAVGVMDMLRYNKFTIGAAWEGDYGSPQKPEEFKALRAYSPLQNIRAGVHYPPTLITTSDHDDRVVPGHSFKYTAALQATQAGPAPILIRIETRAGHGAGKPTTKLIDEAADRFAFLVRELHMQL